MAGIWNKNWPVHSGSCVYTSFLRQCYYILRHILLRYSTIGFCTVSIFLICPIDFTSNWTNKRFCFSLLAKPLCWKRLAGMRNARECLTLSAYFIIHISLSMTFGSRVAMLINWLLSEFFIFSILWSDWKTCAYIVWERNASVSVVYKKKVDAYPRKWHKSLKMDTHHEATEAQSAHTRTHIYIAINTLLPMQICFNFSSFMSFVCSIYCSFFHSLLFIFGWANQSFFPYASERKLPLSVHLQQFNRIQVEMSAYVGSLDLDLVGLYCNSNQQWQWWWRCPYDSLFDFVRFGFLVFRSCNFHICIFPRPQNSALSKYLQAIVRVRELMCVRASAYTHVCMFMCMNMNGWYLMFVSNPIEMRQRTKGMQNATSCTKLSNVSHIKWMKRKKGISWFFSLVSFRFVVFVVFVFWYWNWTVTWKKNQSWMKKITNEVENPTVSDNTALN